MSIEHTFNSKDGIVTKPLTPLKAIRAKCLECMGWGRKAVANCSDQYCAVYPFRFGKNPGRKGIGGKGNVAALANAHPAKNPLTQQRVLTRKHRNPK